MPLLELQETLLQNAGFRTRYDQVVRRSVAQQFPNLALDQSLAGPNSTDWRYMLLCASVLAHSTKGDMQDAALRIAQACINDPSTEPAQRDCATIVLDQLSNRPAIRLAADRDLIVANLRGRLPVKATLDWLSREYKHTVKLPADQSIYVNSFQRAFWDAVHKYDWLSISAPTSAGKSYIIAQYLVERIAAQSDIVVVYLVPTRALIHQVELDMRQYLADAKVEPVTVSTLPIARSLKHGERNVLVFTQERLHIFLAAFDQPPSMHIVVVDEAQKVGDGTRGVLLQQAVERIVTATPQCQVVLSSPSTQNPSILLQDAPQVATHSPLEADTVTVNQNLLWVTQRSGKPKEWYVDLCRDGTRSRLGGVTLANIPSPESKRLSFVAHAMSGSSGGALLYLNGAAAAEKAAAQLADLLSIPKDQSASQSARADLIELVKATIHPSYSLAVVLERGVAFHYGNMPLLVRDEIERLFKEGHLEYLCCTSTLIEGVNLPCKNIFVRGPKKGNGNPMRAEDFWNLAGRAGRWGKEFQGNIVCVDAADVGVWNGTAPLTRTKFTIARTTDQVLGDPANFLDYLVAKAPMASHDDHPEWEYVFSYLAGTYLREGTISGARWARRVDPATVVKLEAAIAPLCDTLRIDKAVVWRNPGISPLAMDSLLAKFAAGDVELEDLMLVAPSSNDAVDKYTQAFGVINEHFGIIFGEKKRRTMLAIIVVNWMRGHPLARIISARLAYLRKNAIEFDLQTEIRASMKDVEQVARFQAPKYLSCYTDVLRQYLLANDRSDLADGLLDVSVLLEFGVSTQTPLSLMGLGLSRTTAIALYELIAKDDLSEAQCVDWLKKFNIAASVLPRLVRREVEQTMQLLRTR